MICSRATHNGYILDHRPQDGVLDHEFDDERNELMKSWEMLLFDCTLLPPTWLSWPQDQTSQLEHLAITCPLFD